MLCFEVSIHSNPAFQFNMFMYIITIPTYTFALLPALLNVDGYYEASSANFYFCSYSS